MKVRLRFSKVGKVRFTSHRDVARMWERAFRRANLPVAATEGFSPRPRLSFGLALPTGAESLSEYLDADLVEAVDAHLLPEVLSPCLPVGIEVQAAAPVEPGTPSLQSDVIACSWVLQVLDTDPTFAAAEVERFLAASTWEADRTRKGVTEPGDIRPSVERLEVLGLPADGQGVLLGADLATAGRGLRPSELAAVVGGEVLRALRTHQWIERDGARREPLPAAMPSLALTPVEARA